MKTLTIAVIDTPPQRSHITPDTNPTSKPYVLSQLCVGGWLLYVC